MTVLVIDIGTTGVRAAVMHPDATLGEVHYRHLPPTSPFPGLVEFDPVELADAAIDLANRALDQFGAPVSAVGLSTQRASTVVWDRATGVPIGPGLGWQDLRTVMECITAKAEHGFALAPNQSATKVAWLLNSLEGSRGRDLCFGTVDSWLAWRLTGGDCHVTDRTNAAITGLTTSDCSDWNDDVLKVFDIPRSMLPTFVDTSGPIGAATALHGAPLLAALVGDQQGSLIGQSCVRHGDTKITFGTGGMLDVCIDDHAPASARRGPHGTFPVIAWSIGGQTMWGVEGIMLSAGTNIEWLRDDMGLIDDAADSHTVAQGCTSTDGVVYVPALLGLGTPHWDYGARGSLFGLTRGTQRAHVVRAVLEGIAHRGADLVEAAEADTGTSIGALRVDGGMSRNPTFIQALADATQRVVEIAPVADATTMGAGYLAGLASGVWASLDDVAAQWRPAQLVEPAGTLDRDRWADAIGRAASWIPDLSALDF
ncbi:MAG: glpK [Ilumatobacteraceae bacterium]|nr:glpK [Ilumatobacteraceae bacterium]